ncbi:Uu.00g120580.m01.CDS01 [Anthostomella pinea]|uniref:Uu.00g120580.m01.CDS01 n=1 Tax=Anthostomella pinea TaxID=933095 RepID=A0AAI8YH79_9PEZI|nr:Uu.00g120580.m01.CDS01 [Anthostomella pinea]
MAPPKSGTMSHVSSTSRNNNDKKAGSSSHDSDETISIDENINESAASSDAEYAIKSEAESVFNGVHVPNVASADTDSDEDIPDAPDAQSTPAHGRGRGRGGRGKRGGGCGSRGAGAGRARGRGPTAMNQSIRAPGAPPVARAVRHSPVARAVRAVRAARAARTARVVDRAALRVKEEDERAAGNGGVNGVAGNGGAIRAPDYIEHDYRTLFKNLKHHLESVDVYSTIFYDNAWKAVDTSREDRSAFLVLSQVNQGIQRALRALDTVYFPDEEPEKFMEGDRVFHAGE